MTKMYAVRGANDEVTTCSCCGRDNLKKTVILETLDADGNGTGLIERFGTDCAARAAGWTQGDVKKELTRINKEAEKAAKIERTLAMRREYAARRAAYLASVKIENIRL